MANLDAIFRPKSIAVIGASNNEGSLNCALFMNLIMGNFKGPVFPVNPKYEYVHGIKSYKSISEIPDQVDLAIIMVPRDAVFGIVDRCGQKGVKGLIVITAGFKETGKDGSELETSLINKIKSYGMRMIGPNCFGVMNLSAGICMNATFSAHTPTPGKAAFMSQSGGLGEILIDRADRESLGMAQFASIGNNADVSGNDLLEYWQDDPEIKAILMYLESIGDPRQFGRLARKISRDKPLITLKAGRTARGAAAASSHTGALADQDAANTALFEQYGVIQVNSVESLFKVGSLLVNQPRPKGRNVAVITNAGGPGILMTDALISNGLFVPEIPREEQAKLRALLRPEASVHNPIDVIASGGPNEYRASLETVYNDDNFHSVVVLFIPVTIIDAYEVAEVLVEFAKKGKKPIQVVWLARGKVRGDEAEALLRKEQVPMYEMPLEAAEALVHATQYNEWLEKPIGREPKFSVDNQSVRTLIENVITDGRRSLSDRECFDLLKYYELPTLESRWVDTVDEALFAAKELSWPVVLRA
ncbi:MAG: CoA-binding protein, partial [bacterium]|nr:CoA-binding protein [bacterium]